MENIRNMGFWVRDIAVSEGHRNQMGKLIYEPLSIKGFVSLVLVRLSRIPHAISVTHIHTHMQYINPLTLLLQLIIYLFWSLSVPVSPPVEHLLQMSKHKSQTSHVKSP